MPRKSTTAARETAAATTVEQETPVPETATNNNEENTITNLPAAPTQYNTFAAIAAALPQIGSNFLKHNGNVGGWSLNDIPLKPDEKWMVDKIRYGHKFLQSGHPVEDYPQDPGKPFMQRHELGVHDNEALWPVVEGARKDPVKQYIAVDLLRIRDGSMCSYDALNITGRRALTELISKIAWQCGARGPDAKPVLALDSHSLDMQLRTIWIPTFDIVTWVVRDGHGGMRLETDADRPSLKDELDDEIGF